MENNSTLCCQCPRRCPGEMVDMFSQKVSQQLWRVEASLFVNAILAGVIVGIGAYGHRYRHYGFARYLLLGATALFIPIISYVLSAIGSTDGAFAVSTGELTGQCYAPPSHQYLVIVSTSLVLISAINTSPIVAADDREDRSIRPPFKILLQGIWIAYLTIGIISPESGEPLSFLAFGILFTPFALMLAKLALKYYAFLEAWRSFALRRNPRLIAGYMQQLREGSDQHGDSMTASDDDVIVPPPPLVVMGEDERQVEKLPHGYMFKNCLEGVQNGGLVTIDKVWQFDYMPMQQRMKDICFSYALFKLLRCRFARYKLTAVISTETINFLRNVLIKEGEHERAFRIIADELSFLHDYYDSPLPISYSNSCLTIFSMVISVLSIGYCTLFEMYIITKMYAIWERGDQYIAAIKCNYSCQLGLLSSDTRSIYIGSWYFDVVPTMLLLVLVVVAEARDIASHICSSWTKVILTCRCVHRASMQISPVCPKWVDCLLRCRCNWLMRHWSDKMGQSSMLALHPRQFHQLVFPGYLLRLRDRKRNNVKVPSVVKFCIINAIRNISNGASVSKGMMSLRESHYGESLLWACNNKGTSDTILVWHIATVILEVMHPHHQDDHHHPPRQTWQGGHRTSPTSDDKKTATTHLSRYCAYLVEFCPELLPDDDAWSKGLYKDVKKEVERTLATARGTEVSSLPPEAGYRRLIELLGARQNHNVLKDAAKLAEQLGELTTGGEEMVWELLAGFWSEMVLYLAPSDNMKGHMEAIDRGGELITLLWAMLTHIGIVDRPESAAASASSSHRAYPCLDMHG